MARLTSRQGLTLEIEFGVSARGYIGYRMRFLWKEESLVDSALLRVNTGKSKRARRADYFFGDQPMRDTLIAMLDESLSSNLPDYWETVDPAIKLVLYPDMGLPLMPSHYETIYESPRQQAAREKKMREKARKGNLPGDPVTLIALADTEEFHGEWIYTGDGVALIMCTTRKQMQVFIKHLKEEWDEADSTWHYADMWKRDDEDDDEEP